MDKHNTWPYMHKENGETIDNDTVVHLLSQITLKAWNKYLIFPCPNSTINMDAPWHADRVC
jgi:hypothetical protein